MAFNKQIQTVQLEQLFRQLVDNCHLNLSEFADGTGGGWARFLWGHPEQCPIPDKSRPVVFLYGVQFSDSFKTICTHERTITAVLGIQAFCNVLNQTTSGPKRFDRLWARIQYALDSQALRRSLPGTYTLENADETETTYSGSNIRFGDMGVRGIGLLGSNTLKIENGEIKRYQQQVELTVRFPDESITVGPRNVSITTV